MTSTTPTLVTFLLDRSGSMELIKAATIEAFNAYIEGLKQEPAGLVFSLVQFDSVSIDTVVKNAQMSDVAPLTEKTFQPRGGTPLIDAAVKTIRAVERKVLDMPQAKVVICIQTDGEENESREHSWEELRALISQKQEQGWQFNFMGAGIDAYAQASAMGISAGATMSYDAGDLDATRDAFYANAVNTQSYARGMSTNTNYSAAQKRAAGDKFDPALKQKAPKDVDL